MLASLLLAATAAVGGGSATPAAAGGGASPDFGAIEWWNSPPLTLGRLKGRAIFVESFRTW
jgi:hypothetical protein